MEVANQSLQEAIVQLALASRNLIGVEITTSCRMWCKSCACASMLTPMNADCSSETFSEAYERPDFPRTR